MPAMLQAKGKATQIAEELLGKKPKKKSKKLTIEEQRLLAEDTRLVR